VRTDRVDSHVNSLFSSETLQYFLRARKTVVRFSLWLLMSAQIRKQGKKDYPFQEGISIIALRALMLFKAFAISASFNRARRPRNIFKTTGYPNGQHSSLVGQM
jgi:hypothetical protein